jgi:hypothetical protein
MVTGNIMRKNNIVIWLCLVLIMEFIFIYSELELFAIIAGLLSLVLISWLGIILHKEEQ